MLGLSSVCLKTPETSLCMGQILDIGKNLYKDECAWRRICRRRIAWGQIIWFPCLAIFCTNSSSDQARVLMFNLANLVPLILNLTTKSKSQVYAVALRLKIERWPIITSDEWPLISWACMYSFPLLPSIYH